MLSLFVTFEYVENSFNVVAPFVVVDVADANTTLAYFVCPSIVFVLTKLWRIRVRTRKSSMRQVFEAWYLRQMELEAINIYTESHIFTYNLS